ncbi:hypothetical protein VOLCADRAFT_120780 [Volvox carteri f. nagariensis]|uniref:Fatty acid desaturase domain-containing protein n=1 Tax=Volvox carteri f. nagariensis TaxID=3068 RepID=D8TTE4_VOLCA|nr:uncharacterized protein VOLCADRAFT_120780 [Volvox carteri f. nagariensis]EFJ49187.1 hypothetical protein VOLCADRAFT_120780 [Volvox carteri f. nagariensis]|eukprot:XP_002949635.1 hypothetical protein VOLCADRAFT_120780 [Volvox carteri f. nagariensis]
MLLDPRDEPIVHLLCNQLQLVIPSVVLLFAFNRSHWLGMLYLAFNYGLFLQRFMLTLHFTEHRSLFKQRFGFLNLLIPYILCNFYGVPGGFYRLHHVVMHHVEGNASPGDLTSTEAVQRDSVWQFIRYWVRFWLCTWFELPAYAAWKGRHGQANVCAASAVVYWIALAGLWRLNSVATLWSLVVPFFVSTFALMFGNWSQHIFVDPDDPRNSYRSTYNCLACPDNCRTYNDGYHIIHHLNSRLHWSELPKRFIATMSAHDENDALVFRGIGFFDVGFMVFTKQLDKLATYIVPCGPNQAKRSHEEWVALLRHRLRPASKPEACCGARAQTTVS